VSQPLLRNHEIQSQGEALFERLFEFSPDGIILTGRQGEILRVNAQVEKMFGYARDELQGQPIELLAPDRFRRQHLEHRQAYLAEPRVRPMGAGLALYARRKDGTEFPVDIMLSPVKAEEGLVISVVRDVTERRRAEEQLRESERRFRQIAEKIREVFFLMDLREVRMLYVSPAYEEIWGRSCRSLYESPMSWFDAIHPEDRERIAPAVEKFLADGLFDQEYRIIRPDGSVRWIWDRSFSAGPAKEGALQAVGIAEDITERKLAEEALRENEERFRSLVEGVQDYAIFTLDHQGHVSSWNTGAARIKGYPAEEIIGKHFSVFYTPEDIKRGKPQAELKTAEAQGRVDDEGWRLKKDGSRFWAYVVITALRDQSGGLRGFSKITRDMTERRKAQQALLLEVTSALVSHLDIRTLLAAISSSIHQVVPHDHAALALYDESSRKLRLQLLTSPGPKDPEDTEVLLPLEGSPSGRAFTAREPVVLDRMDAGGFDPAIIKRWTTLGVKSACWLPLINRARALGALMVGAHRENAFTEENVRLLGQVANQIAVAIDNALTFGQMAELKDRLAEEKLYLEEELRTEYNFDEIIGESAALKRVLKRVETVATTDATVLIQGDTGTGKELVARAIHNLSPRRQRTFAKLNCAAIPVGLLESELFGHEKGAFTGAIAQKIGRLELAHQGTLFLDEVGDVPLEIQPKLLRALQEKEFERLGSNRTIPVDVRLIAATNRDLERMVADRQFRSDLYYRLKVFPVTVPPLRERRGDIPILVQHFVQKHARRMGKQIETVPDEVMNVLTRWHWPGNVRELENFIERAVILTQGSVLRAPLAELESAGEPESVPTTLESAEREHILHILRETKGVIAGPNGAADRLGLKRTTLNSKMRKLGISRNDL